MKGREREGRNGEKGGKEGRKERKKGNENIYLAMYACKHNQRVQVLTIEYFLPGRRCRYRGGHHNRSLQKFRSKFNTPLREEGKEREVENKGRMENIYNDGHHNAIHTVINLI